MIDLELRKHKDKLYNYLPLNIIKKLSPNHISIVAFILGAICIYYIFQQRYLIALIFWTASRILDGFDGYIARTFTKTTDFGGFLDTSLDLIIYAGVVASFSIINSNSIAVIIMGFILISLFYVNIGQLFMLGAIIEKNTKVNKNRKTTAEMPKSLVEGFETIFLYCLFFIFNKYISELLLVGIVLMILTLIQRFFWANKNLN